MVQLEADAGVKERQKRSLKMIARTEQPPVKLSANDRLATLGVTLTVGFVVLALAAIGGAQSLGGSSIELLALAL
jgi:hypothetical protein